jgi:multidrug efflux pump subunit AcrA (membrane-fusion protein)
VIPRIKRLFSTLRTRSGKTYAFIKRDIQKRPLTNFYLCLAALVLLIALSNFLQAPPKLVESKTINPKDVRTYTIGSVPKMTVQAQIEKSGVVKLVALSGGVVQQINYKEGDPITKGSTVVSLSTNYQGGNTFSVQRQLAQTQYTNATDTYDLQKDLIQQQRNVATTSAENAEKLRDITGQSRQDTKELIELNRALLNNVNTSLADLQNNPQSDSTMIASLQGQKAQLLGALAQADTSLAQADYQSDTNRPPAELARLQKDIALKQLDLQERTLNLGKESARLQLQLAQVTEALMFPASPVTGVIQRIFVKVGDVVAPGAQLAIIAQNAEEDPITAVAYVPANVAEKVSLVETSILKLGTETYEEYPYFISKEAVQGNSYAVYYAVPDSFSSTTTDKGYIDVEIPVGYADTTMTATYIPLDAVYQTSDSAYLFVNDHNKAKSRQVTLGNVYGNYVEVVSGLKDGDRVITTRNVIDGDTVQIIK